ncbi:uncharacterized protein LOC121386068 [Gigantopelta aegis]|uniref:uncharacterized protein LOC121386068 n=1 Tax=Gigantopelta aegis TaxID=1735272 RepID=UPI001B887DD7|nr:uncharacterized protein LOC121386068 [Gigantopelta aegis]
MPCPIPCDWCIGLSVVISILIAVGIALIIAIFLVSGISLKKILIIVVLVVGGILLIMAIVDAVLLGIQTDADLGTGAYLAAAVLCGFGFVIGIILIAVGVWLRLKTGEFFYSVSVAEVGKKIIVGPM